MQETIVTERPKNTHTLGCQIFQTIINNYHIRYLVFYFCILQHSSSFLFTTYKTLYMYSVQCTVCISWICISSMRISSMCISSVYISWMCISWMCISWMCISWYTFNWYTFQLIHWYTESIARNFNLID